MGQRSSSDAARSSRRRWLGWAAVALALIVFNVIAIGAWAADRYTRTNPSFCGSCHIMKSHVDSYLNSNHMDSVHRMANVGCKDCHANYTLLDEARSVAQYVSGRYERVLSQRKVGDDMCLRCHVSLEYHANRTDYLTRNPHLSHWPNLRCASCHMSHDKQVDFCARCHENGGQRMTEGPVVPRAHNPWTDPNRQRPNVK